MSKTIFSSKFIHYTAAVVISLCLSTISSNSVAQTTNNPPFGWIDTQALGIVAPGNSVQLSGWAADQEDGAPVTKVQILLDGTTLLGTASLGASRPDVAAAFNDSRYANSGWTFTCNTTTLPIGQHTISAVAYDSLGTSAQLQGIATIVVDTSPIGWLDPQTLGLVSPSASLQVFGWAADQEDGSPVAAVKILLDGTTVLGNAGLGLVRTDVATYLNDSRYRNSGWSFSYNVAALSLGDHYFTAVAYDSQGASTQLPGKATFTITSSSLPDNPPFGWLDSQSATRVVQNTAIDFFGWAADKEDGSPVMKVQMVLDGTTPVGTAALGVIRPDVASYYNNSAYGDSGWSFSYNIGLLSPGEHTLTAVAYDSSGIGAQLQGTAAFTVVATNSGPVIPTANPQVAAYSVNAPGGSSVNVDFGLDTNYDLQTSLFPAPPGGGTVRVLVAGMKANSTYHMRAAIHLADGTVTYDADQVFTTGGYSSTIVPSINVTHFNQAAEAPGVQMLDSLNLSNLSLTVVDRDGNLLWAYNSADVNVTDYFPAKPLPNGDFLLLLNGGGMREIDLSGAVVNEFTQSQVQSAMQAAGYQFGSIALHHDIQKLTNGHYILLGQITKSIVLNGDSSPTNVIGDILIDLDPNLNVTWVWNSFDHLDVNRHPFSTTDWTHSNAVVLTADGNLLLSMRHQSWILKIDYQNGTGTGNVLWRLGYQGDFALQSSNGVIDWFYMQHYPNILSEQNGTMRLAIFDNGDNRLLDAGGDMCGTTGQIACYSRGLVMDVDETNMTATVEYQHTLSEYSFWGGSIQQMPNGNYVVGMSATSLGSRAEEFTGDSAQSPVWQMDVIGQGAAMYRSLRLPSLYPGVTWP